MKTFRNHILQGLMLLLVLIYSTPIKLLHNCSNLNHHHEGVSVEKAHEECLICDLQFHPFIATAKPTVASVSEYPTILYSSFSGTLYHTESNACLNKGPPAVI